MLKKVFLTLIALFFILFGSLILMMGYVFNNPEKVFTAFNSMTEKFMESQPYEETEEFFIQGLKTLSIHSKKVDVNIHIYDGSTLKVAIHGKIPRFDSGPYITLEKQDAESLVIDLPAPTASQWVQMNINGHEYATESDADLTAEVYLPASFKKNFLVKTETGDINLDLDGNEIYELDLSSNSGQITNNQKNPTSPVDLQEVGKIKISTDKGSILVKP